MRTRCDHSAGRLIVGDLMMLIFSMLIVSCSGNSRYDEINASGTIEATDVNISSKTAGDILMLLVTEGTRVRVGDTIAVIDHSTLDLNLRQAEAGVKLADAQLRMLHNGARSEDIQRAEDALTQAEAALKIAEDDARRMEELFGTQSITKKQKDDVDARHTVALAQYNSAQQALKKIRKIARPEEIQAAEAYLEQAIAARDLLKKTISDCYIASPIGGIVTNKPVEAGELVGPGSIVATVSKLDTVELMIYVNEIELGWVKLGQKAKIAIDACPERTFDGTVVYISPIEEFTPKNIQTKDDKVKLVFGVKIEIPNQESVLKPGMPADAIIVTN